MTLIRGGRKWPLKDNAGVLAFQYVAGKLFEQGVDARRMPDETERL
jgi:hypothetical protein